MLGWWNENDVYDDEDYSSKSVDDKEIDHLDDNGLNNNELNEIKFGAEHKICEQSPEKTVDSSIMKRSLCPWQWR